MKYLIVSAFLFMLSCQPPATKAQKETLEVAEKTIYDENLRYVGLIKDEVDETGRRPENIKLLEIAQKIMRLRDKHAFTADQPIDELKLGAYLQDFQKLMKEAEKNNVSGDLSKNYLRLNRLLQEKGNLTSYLVMLEIAGLEKNALEAIALRLGHN